MRRHVRHRLPALGLVLLVAIVAPVGASAKKKPKPSDPAAKPHDGTLAVEGGRGVVQIAARGSIIGQVVQGRVLVVDRNPSDGVRPQVRGWKGRNRRSRTTTVYWGRNIRYRLAGAFYRVRVDGLGIDLSAVGVGSVTLKGDDRYADTGLYSLNGADFTPVPYEQTTLRLAAPPPATG